MTAQLSLWLVGGAVVLGILALFAVVIARSMERKTATASVKTGKASDAAALHEGLVGDALKYVLSSSKDGKTAEAEAKEKTQSKGGVIAAVIGAAITMAVSAGIASDMFDKDIDVAGITPVEVTAGDLHGTLLMPKKSSPIVLIVPGSGPTDRDGNNPMGVKAQSYKLLAEALAEEGVATVRVDKRGMFGSAGAGDPNAVTIEQYAHDYRAWIDALRAETGRNCIFLLGHSEGALMVSAAAEGRKDVCGLILVSGMGRKLGDVLREQLMANPANAPLLDQAFAAIADLEAGRHADVSNMHPALMQLFAPSVQDYLISLMAADPIEILSKARRETLILHGTTDLQVTAQDARLLNTAPRTELDVIRGMNHVLKKAPEDRAANLATYADPSLPLHPKLADAMGDFVREND